MRRPLLVRSLLVIALLLAGGCGAFRASIGVGLGLGASVHAGPLDVGGLGGVGLEWGNAYGIVGSMVTGEVGLPGLVRAEMVMGAGPQNHQGRVEGPVALIARPVVDDRDFRRFLVCRPLEVAVSGYALLVAFHLGFDVQGLFADVVSWVNGVRGVPEDDPPPGTHPALPPPEDTLDEPPYAIRAVRELGQVDSFARRATDAARELDRAFADPGALVQLEHGERDWFVAPALALRLGRDEIPWATREALVDLQQVRGPEELRRATTPEAIAHALLRYPLAANAAEAMVRRGDLLLERGELAEAHLAFEDAVAAIGTSDPAALARARICAERARGLREAALAFEPEPAGASWTGSADLYGHRIGASGRTAWALAASGDIAWERSDALPEGFYAARVVGEQSGLAVVEAVAQGRAWVVGLDESAVVRWRTPLPAASPACGPVDHVFALGLGRVFVVRTDRVVALDAATGRVLWMSVRETPSYPREDLIPAGYRLPPGPPRRRPDGPDGFRVRLSDEVLETCSGRGRPVERFDPRTGRPVHD